MNGVERPPVLIIHFFAKMTNAVCCEGSFLSWEEDAAPTRLSIAYVVATPGG